MSRFITYILCACVLYTSSLDTYHFKFSIANAGGGPEPTAPQIQPGQGLISDEEMVILIDDCRESKMEEDGLTMDQASDETLAYMERECQREIEDKINEITCPGQSTEKL